MKVFLYNGCKMVVVLAFTSLVIKPPPPQPFYGPFSRTTQVSRCQKRTSGLWCKGRLTEADTQTVWLGATPSGLTSAYLHHPPISHKNATKDIFKILIHEMLKLKAMPCYSLY